MSAAAAKGSTCNQRGCGWRVPSTGPKASSHRCRRAVKYRNAKPSACVRARSVHAGTRTKPRRKPKSQARCQGSPAMATEQDRPSGRPASLGQSALGCSRSWRNVKCASCRDVPGAGERGARLKCSHGRSKAAFCVAPRPAQGGLATGPECAAYFASLICNAGLVTPSSPARILLRGPVARRGQQAAFQVQRRLRPTRTLLPTPGFGAPSSSCNRTDMSAKHT
jgi:hypothetical protein